MANFDEDLKKIDDTEDLLKLLENQEKKGVKKKGGSAMSFLKGLPVGMIVLVIVIIILGAMVLSLGSNIAALKGDMAEIKNIKTQLADIEGRLEKSVREKDGLKGEINQLRNDMDNMKAQKREAEARAQQQKQQAAKKKPVLEKPRAATPPSSPARR